MNNLNFNVHQLIIKRKHATKKNSGLESIKQATNGSEKNMFLSAGSFLTFICLFSIKEFLEPNLQFLTVHWVGSTFLPCCPGA